MWDGKIAIDSHGRGRWFEPSIAHHHFMYLAQDISSAKLGMCSKLCSFGWGEGRLERGKFVLALLITMKLSGAPPETTERA